MNQWLKKAVLLYFRTHDNAVIDAGYTRFFDKVPLKYAARSQADDGERCARAARVVPPAVARRGSYIAPNVVLMPSYVNIGAYVDSGTMVDTWATVGSCAQIGKNVHLSGGVGIGGVLEPLQAAPTIIEDNCFIGARSEVVEGVIVEERLGDLDGRVHRPEHQDLRPRHRADPAGPRAGRLGGGVGQPAVADGKYSLYCAVIVKRVDAQTRAKTSHQRAAARRTETARRASTRAAELHRASLQLEAAIPRAAITGRSSGQRPGLTPADGRGPRAALTTIYFLLPGGVVQPLAPRHLGRGLAPLRRRTARTARDFDQPPCRSRSRDIASPPRPRRIAGAGARHRRRLLAGRSCARPDYALVGCTVEPPASISPTSRCSRRRCRRPQRVRSSSGRNSLRSSESPAMSERSLRRCGKAYNFLSRFILISLTESMLPARASRHPRFESARRRHGTPKPSGSRHSRRTRRHRSNTRTAASISMPSAMACGT